MLVIHRVTTKSAVGIIIKIVYNHSDKRYDMRLLKAPPSGKQPNQV